MIIYIILVLVLIILTIFLEGKDENYKKIFSFLIGIMLVLIMGLRNIKMGQMDVEYSYTPLFYNLMNMRFNEIFMIYTTDSAFYITTKVFSIIFPNVNAWIFFLAAFYIGTVTYLIYTESKYPSLSFSLFLGLNYYGYNFTLIRHSIAMSFIIWSFIMYKKGKNKSSIIFFIIATQFHISSLVFILVYIIGKKKFGYKQIVILIGVFILTLNFKAGIIDWIFKIFTMDRFARYLYTNSVGSFNYTMFIIGLMVFLGAWSNRKESIKNDKKINIYFNLGMINLYFLCFTTVFDLFFRVGMFFGVFTIILLPNTIYYEKNKLMRKSKYVVSYIISILYFLIYAINNAYINPYSFFWN